MTVTCLRFATACGMSDRLRLDLVLNDFVACALARGEITVLSDGSPWRPLIDVVDMARAIDWAIQRSPEDGGRYLVINTGSNDRNYQVRGLAQAVADALPGTTVNINSKAPVDSRSYRVDFSLFNLLRPIIDRKSRCRNRSRASSLDCERWASRIGSSATPSTCDFACCGITSKAGACLTS